HNKTINIINTKYNSIPNLKTYTHINNQFTPFTYQSIPTTINKTPYILNKLLINKINHHIHKQYTNTTKFTNHLFKT
ncbi:Tn3 family transposase, partial [Bacillus thuringiensis]|nr:Tn3 family transposase [Bacillus thuringiensis]